MSNVLKTLAVALLAFLLPLSVVAYMNRSELKPYIIGDATTAKGELLYFARRS